MTSEPSISGSAAPLLEMPRLVAREWHNDFAEAAFAIYGDPIAMKFLRPTFPVADVATLRERIVEIIARNARFNFRMGSWLLFEKATDELVGTILLKPLPDSEKIEVGWHLAQSHWGKGYATEAGRAALRYGFEHLGETTIYAIVDPANAASIRVCERLKMRHLGQTNDFHDRELEFFSINQSAFAAS